MKTKTLLSITMLFTFSMLCSVVLSAQVHAGEQAIMSQWATNCPALGWNPSSPYTSYAGVTTVSVGGKDRVEKILRTGFNATGEIPQGLLNVLTEITEIRIDGNSMTLQNNTWLTTTHLFLQKVHMGGNEFTTQNAVNQLLLNASVMTQLYAEDFVNNGVAVPTPLPATVSSTAIQIININRNQFNGALDIALFPSVTQMYVENNNFQNLRIPGGTGPFWGPQYFYCSYNDFSDVLEFQAYLDRATKLFIWNAVDFLDGNTHNFNNLMPAVIASNNASKEFYLGYNRLTGTVDLTLFQKVYAFHIDHNQISNVIIPVANAWLREVNLSHNQLSNLSLNLLNNMPQLQRYYLNDNQISGSFPDPVSVGGMYDLEKIKTLDLSANQMEGVIRIDWILQKQRSVVSTMHVEELRFSDNFFTSAAMISPSGTDYANLVDVSVDLNKLEFETYWPD